jgi:DNA polymerase alpha subunit A
LVDLIFLSQQVLTVIQDGEEKIPEPPSSDVPQGVLPRLIATLVNRRRQVKSLMKDRTASHAKLLQVIVSQHPVDISILTFGFI